MVCCSVVCCVSTISLFFVLVYAGIKSYLNYVKGIYEGNERLEGKTVIVTGSSAGIGLETAKDLARRGARVLMLCRDLAKAERVRQYIIDWTGNKNVVLKLIDFSSLESVRRCAREILAEESRIDVLINNAGAVRLGFDKKTEDGLEVLMQTNHFGPFLLTNLLLDKIKESAPARIVNVSSSGYKMAKLDLANLEQKGIKNIITLYGNTKLANIYTTLILDQKLKGTGVTANCLHPGVIKTEILRNENFINLGIWILLLGTFAKTLWEGAQTTIFLAVSPSVKGVSGKYFQDCKETGLTAEGLDYLQAEKLWTLSEKAVNLKGSEKHI